MSATSTSRRHYLVLVVWATLIVGYVVYSRQRGLGAVEAAEELRSLLAAHWWGVPLFIAVYVARPIVLFPASVLTILAGLAFGPWWGVALTVVASNLSTAANYGVGRYFASPTLIEQRSSALGGSIRRAIDRPFETTLIMRLVALPFDAVGYLAGFARLSFWPFMTGSAIGTIAGTIAFVLFGASIESLDEGSPSLDVRLIAASVALTLAGVAVARWLRARNPVSTGASTGETASTIEAVPTHEREVPS